MAPDEPWWFKWFMLVRVRAILPAMSLQLRSAALALLCALTTPATLRAQDVLDAISRDLCPCLDALNGEMPKDTLTMKIGVCMLQRAMPYQKELKRKHGVDLSRFDHDTGAQLGNLIGTRLVANCPSFVSLAMRLSQENETSASSSKPAVPATPLRVVHGTVQEVTPSQFLTITVKTDDGRSYEFLLLDHVANVEQITQEPGKARGFHAKWGYEERELYDPYSRTYKNHRVLRTLEP